MRWFKRGHISRVLFSMTLALCVLLFAVSLYLGVAHGQNNLFNFTEAVSSLANGWTITDSEGNSRELSLPETIEYGKDGLFTLTRTLPEVGNELLSPAFRFYSNYVDVSVAIDGQQVYSFPPAQAAFNGATGNTYHFVRLPADYAGKTISVSIRCQLGDDITYLLNPSLLGSKATMLRADVIKCLPSLMVSGCMCVLAVGLGALFFGFKKRMDMNNDTLYTALFTLLFAVYSFFETPFAQMLIPNGYMLCFITLMLLALIPIPLIGVFENNASKKYMPLMTGFMALCVLNLIAQMVLNMAGVASVRVMLPATHAVMIISIIGSSLCLFCSDRNEKASARRSLLSAIPMIAGGIADIVLLNINMPSTNNCFWFSLGVIVFIIHQIYGFINGYFTLYHASVEAKLLADLAYHDTLAGIDNRNAYERKLKELSAEEPSRQLCCIVLDINDLKMINDNFGHQAGDMAIAEVGMILCEFMPEDASCFRTGGDEFVVLLEDCDVKRTQVLAETVTAEAKRRGRLRNIPINLAVGFGQYADADGNIIDFIRRVDTYMYECKRGQKGNAPGETAR